MTASHHLLQRLPVDLCQISLPDWRDFFDQTGIGREYQKKIFEAIFHSGVTQLEDLTELTAEVRSKLKKYAVIHAPVKDHLLRSRDGSFKLTLRLHDGLFAETVLIPEWENGKLRKCSVSISSQIGCFFGCSFCATGRMGFHRNLTTGELIAQVREAEKVAREELGALPTHLYFMGMGEPMHNYRAVSDALHIMRDSAAPGPTPENITVSTVGLFRQIRMLATDHPDVRLAVSIHSADHDTRYSIMPVSSRLNLSEIRDALVFHNRKTGNPATIQYLLLNNINDHPEDAEKLLAWLNKLQVFVTLIAYNKISGYAADRPDNLKISAFQKKLLQAGIATDIRWCYGEDIGAGCGQLGITPDINRSSFTINNRTGTNADNGMR